MQSILIAIIVIYQWSIGLLLRNYCRFHPTCSNYARQAIERHGAVKGSWQSMKRLLRCHPWHDGGLDPVR